MPRHFGGACRCIGVAAEGLKQYVSTRSAEQIVAAAINQVSRQLPLYSENRLHFIQLGRQRPQEEFEARRGQEPGPSSD